MSPLCTHSVYIAVGVLMKSVNVREAREQVSRLLDSVEAGEEVLILRRGKPAARLVAPQPPHAPFLRRAGLRESLPPIGGDAAAVIRGMRDEERF